MDDNNQDVPEVLETPEQPEETVEETPEVEEETITPEELASLRAKAAKADELEPKNKQLFERLKKAEAAKPAEAPQQGYSLSDIHALTGIHADDVERVERFAKSEGVSIREALKSDDLKAIIAVRTEKRETASAANVTNVRRGPSKVSEDVLLSKADKGQLPDSDDEIARLIAAKYKSR